MTKSRVFFLLLISFILGVAAASFIPLTVAAVGMVFVFGFTLALFGMMRPGERVRTVVAGCCIALAALGSLRFIQYTSYASLLALQHGARVTLEGVVDAEPERGAKSQQLVFRESTSGERVLVTTRPYPVYHYGDYFQLSGTLAEPENFSNDFDYHAYLAKDRIYSVVAFPNVQLVAEGGGNGLYRLLFQAKGAFSERLNRWLPEPHAAFMAGLILGERRSMPQSLSDELKTTGTTHLVALSGYNITIVADALLKLLTFLALPFSAAFFGAASGVVLFAMLAGAQASVVRAAIMGVIVLIARRFGRQYRVRNALALAAALMLFQNPAVLRFDIGFQLSFLATLGLLYGAPLLECAAAYLWLRMWPKLRAAHLVRDRHGRPHESARPRMLREILLATLSAQLFVLPLLVHQFGNLSLVSPLANLAVLPLIPATMGFGFLTGVGAFVSSWLARALAAVSWALLHYELTAIKFFAYLPYAALAVRGWGLGVFLALYTLIGALLWKYRNYAYPKS